MELPIRLIYNDPNRSFGGPLNIADQRLKHYMEVFDAELCRVKKFRHLPPCGCQGAADSSVPGHATPPAYPDPPTDAAG